MRRFPAKSSDLPSQCDSEVSNAQMVEAAAQMDAQDVAHLFAVWARANDAEHAVQHSSSSRKWRSRFCTFTHANQGQLCNRPHDYHMQSCCMDCSLTCADRWLPECAPVCACVASLSSMQQTQSCEQVLQTHHMSRLSQRSHATGHSTSICTSSHALQATI